MGINMKAPFLLLSFAVASILTIAYAPFARAQAPQSDANQAPGGPPATTQGGPEVSRRGGGGGGRGGVGKKFAGRGGPVEVSGPHGTQASLDLQKRSQVSTDQGR